MSGKSWLILVAGVTLGVAALSNAPHVLAGNTQSANCCVATLDVVFVFNEFQRQKDLDEELKQKKAALDAEAERRRKAIEALQTTVAAMDPNDSMFPARRRELLAMQIDAKNWAELAQQEMEAEISFWTARVYQEIITGTESLAASRGVEVVLYRDEFQPMRDAQNVREQIRSRKVVWASRNADLSQAVLDRLNAEYRAKPRTKMLNP
jgi:Skp family chaperone for outer membrane proteins